MVECVFSSLQNVLVIDRSVVKLYIFKLIKMFLKCGDQSSVELWTYFNLIVKLLEVFVVELCILKRGIGAYKNSNIMLVFLHYRVSKP